MTFYTIPFCPEAEITKDGDIRVKTDGRYVDGRPGKNKKHLVNAGGYPCVNIGKKKILIHIAIATCFIPNPDNLPVVMHLDDDITNFSIENLKWGTQKENMEQSSDTGYYSTQKKSVNLISPEGELVEVTGLRTFCSEHNLDWGNFKKMLNRKPSNNSIKGWRLAD